MKVILTEDHDTLGLRGDVVEVKNGYGRNFLVPRQLAVIASKSNVKRYTEERRQQEHKLEARREKDAQLAAKLEGTEVVIAMKTGEEDRIFGSITTQQIAEGLEAQGLPVDRRKITLNEDIKTVGVYPATVRISPEHTAEVKVKVVPNEETI